ncbi:Hypothetical predicted protein [Marmota monax]|uniref:Uncharacterized protein n=1 Tax=Marmota monax TaxID=9995 RepID=A0A5E4B2Q5_MARMO|nr:Hypothetical predicted protein [Marmota monax]
MYQDRVGHSTPTPVLRLDRSRPWYPSARTRLPDKRFLTFVFFLRNPKSTDKDLWREDPKPPHDRGFTSTRPSNQRVRHHNTPPPKTLHLRPPSTGPVPCAEGSYLITTKVLGGPEKDTLTNNVSLRTKETSV